LFFGEITRVLAELICRDPAEGRNVFNKLKYQFQTIEAILDILLTGLFSGPFLPESVLI
jgi:hypothetical protein